MGPGGWILAGVVGGALLLAASQAWFARRARASVGKEVQATGPFAEAEGRLVWFHAPSCGPCRAMAADVDALGDRVIAIDVSRDPELAAEFGVMATPTTLVVRDGKVVDVMLGAVPRGRLEAVFST